MEGGAITRPLLELCGTEDCTRRHIQAPTTIVAAQRHHLSLVLTTSQPGFPFGLPLHGSTTLLRAAGLQAVLPMQLEGRLRSGSGGGCRVLLTFEAVSSAFYCWLNGQLVGYSQDSCLPAEFDVTSLLQDGVNVLAVQVRQAHVVHPAAFLVADWLPEWTRWLARGGLQMT